MTELNEAELNEAELIFELDRLIVEGLISESAADEALEAGDDGALRELVETARQLEKDGWTQITDAGGRLVLA